MRISDWSSDVCSSDLGERPVAHQRLDAVRQFEQAHQVRNMAARLTDQLGERFLIMAEILDQLAIGARFLDRVQILSLDIFDARDLVGGGVVQFAHQRSEEHTSELQSLMRHSYPVSCLNKNIPNR